jgi:hypothetical protein
MKRRSCRSIALTSLLFSLIVLLSFPVIAQEDAEEATDASPVVAPAATVQESDTDEPAIPMVSVQAEADEDAPEQPVYRRRLPNYYSRVVDENQRETIYEIQREYFDQIAALRARITALELDRNGKIEAVLSAEQLAAVQQIEETARLERERKVEERGANDSSE